MCSVSEAAVGQQNVLSLESINREKFLNKLFNFGSILKKDIKIIMERRTVLCLQSCKVCK